MKILYIGAADFIRKRGQSGNSWEFDLFNHLALHTESLKLYTDEFQSNKNKIKNFNPSLVVIFDCDRPRQHFNDIIHYFNNERIKVVLLANDLFHYKLVTDNTYTGKCDAILFTVKQEKLAQQYRDHYPGKYVGGLENFVNISKFHSHLLKKEYDITIYGTLNNQIPINTGCQSVTDWEYFEQWKKRNGKSVPTIYNFYPLRKRIADLVISSGKYKINYIPVSKAGCWGCPIRGERLSEEIAKSYLALATRSRGDRCMQKYLEITASGTYLLGNLPTDFSTVFNKNTVQVSEDMTDDEILRVIDDALEDKVKLEKKSAIFAEKIKHMYGGDLVVKDFLEHCKNIK